MTAELMNDCDAYLKARTGCFRWRSVRYRAAWEAMKYSPHGLSDNDIVLDLGAGWTEFDVFLRMKGWHGRYWPVDGWMGVDLRTFEIPRNVEWIVLLEVIEHLECADVTRLLSQCKIRANKGVVLTTPNHGVVDCFAMDPTHVFAPSKEYLRRFDFTVEERKLYGTDKDSLLARWSRG